MADNRTIHIIMEGGIIHDILGIPEDVVIIVRDYDMDGITGTDEEREDFRMLLPHLAPP